MRSVRLAKLELRFGIDRWIQVRYETGKHNYSEDDLRITPMTYQTGNRYYFYFYYYPPGLSEVR
jgi:hypothetical protein